MAIVNVFLELVFTSIEQIVHHDPHPFHFFVHHFQIPCFIGGAKEGHIYLFVSSSSATLPILVRHHDHNTYSTYWRPYCATGSRGDKRVGRSEWVFDKQVDFAHSLIRDPQG